MGAAEVSAIVAVVALLLNAGFTLHDRAKRGTQMQAAMDQAVQTALHDIKMDGTKELNDLRRDIESSLDSRAREFGEVGTAMRIKIHEVELHIRDNYAHKKDVDRLFDVHSLAIKSIGEKVDARADRLEARLDMLASGRSG